MTALWCMCTMHTYLVSVPVICSVMLTKLYTLLLPVFIMYVCADCASPSTESRQTLSGKFTTGHTGEST